MLRAHAFLAFLAVGCTPNLASLSNAKYIAFLSDGTSLSLTKGFVPVDEYDVNYNVDCREFENKQEEDALKLPDALRICGEEVWPPTYEEWAVQAGFQVVSEPLEPWRADALITSEGDLQLAFHHRIPGGKDMRFMFTVDPNFAPTTCQAGNPLPVPLDGDWVSNWSSTELDWVSTQVGDDSTMPGAFDHLEPYLEGGQLFFLNSFSYQYNPADADGADWDVPEEWAAGAAQGKFVEEDVFHRTARYGNPQLYNAFEVAGYTGEYGGYQIDPDDLWWCPLEPGEDPYASACMTSMEEEIRGVQQSIFEELERMMKPEKDGDAVFAYAPLGHVNYWRPSDGLAAGFDGWGELHYNYVVFSGDSLLEAGGSARGAFSLVLDASQSSSRLFLTGEFVVDKIRKDRWTTDNLMVEKLQENGSVLCSAASPEDGQPPAE